MDRSLLNFSVIYLLLLFNDRWQIKIFDVIEVFQACFAKYLFKAKNKQCPRHISRSQKSLHMQ